ncbi:hypothetical protein DENIS_4137 [Desulfonema ishimotonii]|uniref:AMP-binding enzyme C-terminal domain-containing protein n=1 Tax=Desulfonema ishimotonii TaxID=45657 RepID=A0A401G1Q8_9BACT|nr:hypothetical protein [Desulfonema ishimotonii]GBC63144.1 hypothetical protein DENIS_4137 [Desulfonema ishimotonii]
MLNEVVHILQRAGYYLSRMNEQFYFYVDIRTNVSWAVIILMIILYKVLEKYLSDKELSSDELMKLLLTYILIISAIIASYTDLKKLFNAPDRESSFVGFLVLSIMLIVVIARLGVSKDQSKKMKWILLVMYTPILLIILTNGRVLEERLQSFRNLMPRSNSAMIGLPGEIETLQVGGIVSPHQRQRVEAIIRSQASVRDAALIGRKDKDGLIKPYALILPESGYEASESLKRSIRNAVTDAIEDEQTTELRDVDAVKKGKLPKSDGDYPKMEEILNTHKSVARGVVIAERDSQDDQVKPYAYVELRQEYSGSDRQILETEILGFVNEQYNRDRLSDYLAPRWVDFVDKEDIPKEADGTINYDEINKERKNWSDVFRALGEIPLPTGEE